MTGASSGIGHAIALELAGAGADLVIHARANRRGAEETARLARELGVRAEVILADVGTGGLTLPPRFPMVNCHPSSRRRSVSTATNWRGVRQMRQSHLRLGFIAAVALAGSPCLQGQDCNGNGVADLDDIFINMTSQDCNINIVPDECDLASGFSEDCNSNNVPDECDDDCNTNLIADECDIDSGFSEDCNSNSVPDECDVAAATSQDCDGNLIPDECDLTSGAADCNRNRVLDSCEIPGSFQVSLELPAPTGSSPHVVAVGDLDADGDLDLVTTDRRDDTLSVLLNNGDATFQPRSVLAVNFEPRGLGIADVNGDNKLDLVSGDASEEAGDPRPPVNSVLFGNGNGTFGQARQFPATSQSVGITLRTLCLADFDNDGDFDIANGFFGNLITVLTNPGTGVFSAPREMTNDVLFSQYITCGDVNGDSRSDIVSAGGQVFLSGFGPSSSFSPINNSILGVTLFHLDGDPDLDVAVARTDLNSNEVLLFSNTGGTFSFDSSILVDDSMREGIAAGDFDRDGDDDLVVTFETGVINRVAGVRIILNNGDNSFTLLPERHLLHDTPRSVAVADLNADPKPDIAVAVDGFDLNSSASVFLNLFSFDDNNNDVPDECEFKRGDPNVDGMMNLTDAIFLLNFLFLSGTQPPCLESSDEDDDGAITITDAIFGLRFLFSGGPPPPAPGPPPGVCSAVTGALPFRWCDAYPPCQ